MSVFETVPFHSSLAAFLEELLLIIGLVYYLLAIAELKE